MRDAMTKDQRLAPTIVQMRCPGDLVMTPWHDEDTESVALCYTWPEPGRSPHFHLKMTVRLRVSRRGAVDVAQWVWSVAWTPLRDEPLTGVAEGLGGRGAAKAEAYQRALDLLTDVDVPY